MQAQPVFDACAAVKERIAARREEQERIAARQAERERPAERRRSGKRRAAERRPPGSSLSGWFT